MMGKKVVDALNGQVNAELYSSYLYLAMGAFLSSIGHKGGAYWMKLQALEELYHASKMSDYVQERGGRAIMSAIEKPPEKWDSLEAVFEAVLKHEQKVTGLINDLVKVAKSEKDDDAVKFLAWFVKEQVEEEESAQEMLDLARSAGKDPAGANEKMAARTFKIPKDVTIKFRQPA
jgi:ferritin